MKLLVVVDYQNDFVDGALGFEGADKIDKGIASKVRDYGKGNVFYTLDTHNSRYLDSREGKALPVEHCIIGSKGWEVYGETANALNDVEAVRIIKKVFGIAPWKMLDDEFPANNEVEAIELVGLVTNMCVISNAVIFQARYPNAQIIVDASLCDSFDKELHEKALDVLEGMQVKVINRN